MLKTVKISIAKVVSLLLAMVVLLSVPISAAEAANCTTGHQYWNTDGTTTYDTSTHDGPFGACTITTVYNVYIYTCQKSGCNASFSQIGGVRYTSHSKCP